MQASTNHINIAAIAPLDSPLFMETNITADAIAKTNEDVDFAMMEANLEVELIKKQLKVIQMMRQRSQAPIAITDKPSTDAVTTATTASVNNDSFEGDGADSEMTEHPYVDPGMFDTSIGLLSNTFNSSKAKTPRRLCGSFSCTFEDHHVGNCSFVTLGKRSAPGSSTRKTHKSFGDVMEKKERLKSCQTPRCKQPRNHLGLCTEDTTRTSRRQVDIKNRNCESFNGEEDEDDDVQEDEEDEDLAPNKKCAAELALLADELLKGLKMWEQIFCCETYGEGLEFITEGSMPLCTEFFSGSGMMTQCVMKLHANLGKLHDRKLFTVDSSVVPSAIDIPGMELIGAVSLNQPYIVKNYKADAVFGQQNVLYEHMSRNVCKLALDNYEISIVSKNLYECKWAAVFKWLGFPCTTFSRLSQKRHRRTSTNSYLGRSPEALEANKLLRDIVVSLKTINNGTFCFENPDCSFVNHPVVQAMTQPETTQLGFGARIVRLSFCAFGTPYRKNTVLLTNNTRIVEFFKGDTAYCGCGNRKACRFSGVSHTRLAGSAEETGNMIPARTNIGDGTRFVRELKNTSMPAKQAEQYPERFCMAIAELVYTQTPIRDVRRKFQACEQCVVSE